MPFGVLGDRHAARALRVEQPREVDGLGHAWAKLIASERIALASFAFSAARSKTVDFCQRGTIIAA